MALATGHLAPHAIVTTLSAIVAPVSVVNERVEPGVRFDIHVAAIAPIATVRTALGNEFLAAKTDAAVSPVARFDLDHDLVDKLHGFKRIRVPVNCSSRQSKKAPSSDGAFSGSRCVRKIRQALR